MAAWCDEWDKLGYTIKALFLNAAFVGAAQSRDRWYFVASRKDLGVGIQQGLDFPVAARCFFSDEIVAGVQT